jgi:ABC-type branched-subunit amino acid transport system permease subunit
MSVLPAPIPTVSLMRMQRFPRVVIATTMIFLFAGVGLLLKAESQLQLLVVLLGFVVVFVLADKTAAGQEVSLICGDFSTFTNTAAFAGVIGLIIAFHGDHYALLMLSTVALFSLACIGLNLQMAFAGVANFAGAAFFVMGSYVAAVMSSFAMPSILSLAAGGVVAGALGVLVLFPVLRTRGHYAALVTIAFGLLFSTFMEVNDTFGGPQGMRIRGFSLLGLDFNRLTSIGTMRISFYFSYAVTATVLFALAFTLVRRLERSWIGIALDAARTDETVASAFGLSVVRWKVAAFLVGNAIIGVAGALYGMMNGFVTPNGAGLGESLLLVSIIVLGGLGNLWGAVVAAAVILVIPEKLQSIQEYRLLIFAVLVIGILLFRPAGLMPRQLRDLSWFSFRSRPER